MKTANEMLTATRLKARGWTDGLIKKFLPTPDDTAINPNYISGPMMKLYSRDRIDEIESTPQFIEANAKTARRKEAARKAVETKMKKMQEYLAKLTIEVPILDRDELLRRAKQNFYSLGLPDAVEISDERMCVNYLRHCLTKYESELENIAGKTGAADAYYDIKQKVLDAIWEEYDWLADECWQQTDKMRKDRFECM